MNLRHSARTVIAASLLSILGAVAIMPNAGFAQPPASPSADAPAPQERIAEIKKSFAQSQATLRKYEWIETTVTSLKGEEKGRSQNRCYYGAEGTLQKVVIAEPPEEQPGRGIRGRIKERKKEELTDYMKDAAALVHSYLPPDQERIQACKDAGHASINIVEPGKRATVVLRDYIQSGDALSIEIDLTDNRVLGVSVATHLGSDKDAVSLDVRFATFPDGTIYTAQSTLTAKAKQLTVAVENSGYRQVTP